MRAVSTCLINTDAIELWPAPLLRARSNHDARALARSHWVLRRKSDGGFLAADLPEGLLPLVPRLAREPGLAAALDALQAADAPRRGALPPPHTLPLDSLQRHLAALGIDGDYAEQVGLPQMAEPERLELAGRDRYRRPLWLLSPAARAWSRMRAAAWQDGMALQAISGYRSHAYQHGIFLRKFARGLTLQEILQVNAAPGYSEHHSGRALDIGSPGQAPAEESFEQTGEFRWLQEHAARFGFRMSYPRDNPHGIAYEPWHWCWQSTQV